MVKKYVDIYERVIQQDKVMKEAKELARSIHWQEMKEGASIVSEARLAIHERDEAVYAAFRDALSPSLYLRPATPRQVSVNL
jgi:D-aminopeptidase